MVPGLALVVLAQTPTFKTLDDVNAFISKRSALSPTVSWQMAVHTHPLGTPEPEILKLALSVSGDKIRFASSRGGTPILEAIRGETDSWIVDHLSRTFIQAPNGTGPSNLIETVNGPKPDTGISIVVMGRSPAIVSASPLAVKSSTVETIGGQTLRQIYLLGPEGVRGDSLAIRLWLDEASGFVFRFLVSGQDAGLPISFAAWMSEFDRTKPPAASLFKLDPARVTGYTRRLLPPGGGGSS